jgi:DNA-binding SARP family transcriptional activator/predicted ATPase
MEPGIVSGKQICLYLFGSPRLEEDGTIIRLGRRKSLALLAYLAVTGQPHDRPALAALLWPEKNRGSALAALRQCLRELKNRLGIDLLQVDCHSVNLPAGSPLWVDVVAFQHDLAEGLQQSDPVQLIEAANLYRADFMADFVLPHTPEFDEWQLAQATIIRQQVTLALATIVRLLTGQQRTGEAISYACRWVALDSFNEVAQMALLRLYICTGQIATAVQHYDQFAEQMRAELGRLPSFDLAALIPEIRSSGSAMGERESGPVHTIRPAALPRALTPFAGRTQELKTVITRLKQPDCALLTILGPGGVGKTSLALAAARHVAPTFNHQVYFVPLDSVKDRAGLLIAIAQALALPHHNPTDLEASVKERLQALTCLLILDSFEQLVPEAGLLSDLLQAAPGLKLLVTSRIRLKLYEAWPFPLQGLSYPATAGDPAAATYEAVDFLAQAIQRHCPHYHLTEADWPHLVTICQLVEGLPLGLELAAAWVGQRSLPEIAVTIARQPQQLTAVWNNTPHKHCSLTAVCNHTWQLLAAAERQAAQWLTLFADGFDRDGAKALAVAEPLLMALIDKSLVQQRAGFGPDGRWQMHEVIRCFIQNQMEVEGTAVGPAWQRYIHYYATFLQQRETWLKDRRQQAALAEIQSELANIRAAWRQAAAQGAVAAADMAVTPLYRFYELKGMFRQGVDDFALALSHWQQVLTAGSGEAAAIEWLITRLLIRHGLSLSHLSELEKAESSLQAGVARLCGQGTKMLYEKGVALQGLARVAVKREAWSQAQQLYETSLALFQTVDASLETAQSLSGLAHVACALHTYEEAQRLDQESLAIYQQLDNSLGIATALNNLSHIAEMSGNCQQATLWLQASLALANRSAAHWHTAVALSNLAHLACLQGAYDEAEAYLAEGLKVREQYHLPGIKATAKALTTVADINRFGRQKYW